MLCLAVEVYLTAKDHELHGTARIKCEPVAAEVRDLLRRIAAEAICNVEQLMTQGKWDVGLYLELVQVPPALESFVEWHRQLFDPKKHHLLEWTNGNDGQKRDSAVSAQAGPQVVKPGAAYRRSDRG